MQLTPVATWRVCAKKYLEIAQDAANRKLIVQTNIPASVSSRERLEEVYRQAGGEIGIVWDAPYPQKPVHFKNKAARIRTGVG